MQWRFYASSNARAPAQDFLDALPVSERAAILADIMSVAAAGGKSTAVSVKAWKGCGHLYEIPTWGFRTFF